MLLLEQIKLFFFSSEIEMSFQQQGEQQDYQPHQQPLNNNEPERAINQEQLVMAFLHKLFDLQERRVQSIAESRQLLKDMTETKTWLQRHMIRERVDDLGVESRGRHLKRKVRKVYHRVTVDKLLDKIEAEYGVSERRKFDLWIEQTEDTVAREVTEYKITYDKVRQAGEHNLGAMPPRKRARPAAVQSSASSSSSSGAVSSSSSGAVSSYGVARTLNML